MALHMKGAPLCGLGDTPLAECCLALFDAS